jgi:hypothetical protein
VWPSSLSALLGWITLVTGVVPYSLEYAARQEESCNAPQAGEALLHSLDSSAVDLLAGEYVLVIVASQDSRTRDSIARGRLTLRRASTSQRTGPSPYVTFPLYGATDVDLSRVTTLKLAYPASSTAPEQPGVQAHHNLRTGELTFWLGNAIVHNAAGTTFVTDRGMFLRLLTVHDQGFVGLWEAGHFCATRHEG